MVHGAAEASVTPGPGPTRRHVRSPSPSSSSSSKHEQDEHSTTSVSLADLTTTPTATGVVSPPATATPTTSTRTTGDGAPSRRPTRVPYRRERRACCSVACNVVAITLVAVLCVLLRVRKAAGPHQTLSCAVMPQTCATHSVGGLAIGQFSEVERVFKRHFAEWNHRQAQLVVMHDGVEVVNLVGQTEGISDRVQDSWSLQDRRTVFPEAPAASNSPVYDADALQLIMGSGKSVENLCVAMAVERGYFEYTDKIAKHWPAFAATRPEKADITIGDVLRYTNGACTYPKWSPSLHAPERAAELRAVLADLPLSYVNGTKRCYSATVRGFYLSELFRLTDPKHRSLSQFVQDEVARPLGVDFHWGVTVADAKTGLLDRVHSVHPPVSSYVSASLTLPWFVHRAAAKLYAPLSTILDIGGYVRPSRDLMQLADATVDHSHPVAHMAPWTAPFDREAPLEWLQSAKAINTEISSSAGISNAKSLAKIHALLVNGGELNGVRLVSNETLAMALAQPETTFDAVLLQTISVSRGGWGIDFMPSMRMVQGFYGWTGLGGQFVCWNPRLKLSIALTRTGLSLYPTGDPRADEIVRAVSRAVKAQAKSKLLAINDHQ